MTCFVGPAVRLPDLGPLSRSTAASLSLCQQQQHTRSQSEQTSRVRRPRLDGEVRSCARADGRTGALLAPSPSLPPRFKFNHFEGRGGREALLRTMHGRSLLRWLAVVRAVTMRGRGHDSQGGHRIHRE